MAAIFTTHLDLSFACVVNQSRSYALGASRALFFSSKNGSSGTISYGHFCHPHREKGQSFGSSTCKRLVTELPEWPVTAIICEKNGVLLEQSADLGLKIWSPCR